ncbi:MAG: sigma-70 family RNA polymerase sigma factor [Planctomycetota bacterium]
MEPDDPDTVDTTRKLQERVLAGDEDALGQLFEALRESMLRVVQARLHPSLLGRVDPADVLQDAYIDLKTKLPSFVARDSPMSPFVWIRLVVKERVLLTHRRHLFVAGRDARREANLAQESTASSSSSNALHHCLVSRMSTIGGRLIREEMSTALLKAIESLNDPDREIITMRIFEELTNAETAEILELSENGASSRFVRAMTRLKRAVANIPEVNNYLTTILR